jgi:hypothetical protein
VWGVDEFFPDDIDVTPEEDDVGHGVSATDNEA